MHGETIKLVPVTRFRC